MPIYERADGTWEGLPKGCTVAKTTRLETAYGSYHGGDPREFWPDPECSTAEERKAHREACEAWDRGERLEAEKGGCEFKQCAGGEVLKVQRQGAFGLGTYRIELEALEVTYPDGSVRVFL